MRCSIPSTRELRIVRGPVFTHVLLADEINRAPAKTQSALLEAMQEYQVTLEGQTLPLPQPFFVLATQNPVETEGTYPLPEAQLDRFLFKIEIGYPTLAEEVAVVVRTTTNQAGDHCRSPSVKPVLNEAWCSSLQQIAARQRVDEKVVDYAVRIVRATREWPGLAFGAGSRGAIALVRAARAVALIDGRDFVTPDDIKRIALPALRHRVALTPDAMLEGRKPDDLLAASSTASRRRATSRSCASLRAAAADRAGRSLGGRRCRAARSARDALVALDVAVAVARACSLGAACSTTCRRAQAWRSANVRSRGAARRVRDRRERAVQRDLRARRDAELALRLYDHADASVTATACR